MTENENNFPDQDDFNVIEGRRFLPPKPRLSNEEYVQWIREVLESLPKPKPEELPSYISPGPVGEMFEL